MKKKFFNFRYSFFLIVFCSPTFFTGCFILRPATGANFDKEQIAKAREAKLLDIRLQAVQRLRERLLSGKPIDNADFSFFFNQEMLNNAASQIDSTTGWLDSLNSYFIRSIRITLNNGSAIASLNLAVYNYQYDVDVDLVVDCLLDFSVENGKLRARFEPFTIVPSVSAGGILSTVSGVLEDLVELKLSEISRTFPPIELPINFANALPLPEHTASIRTGINMDVRIPSQTIYYSLQLKEVLIFKTVLFVALNLKDVSVGQ